MSAIPIIPPDYADLLDRPIIAHLGTLRPDGSPHVNPMWFGWDGEHITFTCTTTRQKYRNMTRDPRVSLSILDPQDVARYLEVRGEVVSIEPDPEGSYYVELSRRYGMGGRPPADAPRRVIITVRPTGTGKKRGASPGLPSGLSA